MRRCAREHPECGYPGAVSLPSRVLDLGPDAAADPVLVHSNGLQGRYACLTQSFRGTSQPIKTTRATLDRFSQRIPWDSLPRTFQDSILVARHLGIRYLWIDSLCIVQDDPDDWETQASLMADIYGNAFITIAATTSGGANTGLFPQPDDGLQERRVPQELVPTSSPPLWYRQSLPHMQLQKSRKHADPYWNSEEGADMHEKIRYPLLGRSWTFQEHILSARVVQFAHRELVWECSRTMWCCCTPDDTSEPRSGMKRSAAHLFAPSVGAMQGPRPGSAELCASWKEMIARYNEKSLTNYGEIITTKFIKIRLPALSGMAKSANAILRSTYLAGLWLKDLESQLCWSISTGGVMGSTYGRWLSAYRAPSWSWASVEGPIQWNKTSTRPGHFRIFGAHCTPAGLDATGQVRDGYLFMEGLVVDGSFDRAPTLQAPQQCRFSSAGQSIGFDPDVPFHKRPYTEDLPLGTPLCCLAMGEMVQESTPWENTPKCNFLVLRRRKPGSEIFQRIGWGVSGIRDTCLVAVFKMATKQRIAIV
jgi:hypothetical protein